MQNKNEVLNNYLHDYWEYILKNTPTFATYIGDHRYNDKLEDLSEEAASAEVIFFKDLLAKMDKIDNAQLSLEDRLNNELLKKTLNTHIEMYRLKVRYLPLDQMQGPHLDFPQITEFHPFKTLNDFESYIQRLRAFPRQIDQVIGLLEKGIELKITAFKKCMELTAWQVETFTKFQTEDHPMFVPALTMKDGFSDEEKKDIKERVNELISTAVTPAYKKLYIYLTDEYMKHCREEEGVWTLPDGADIYRFYAHYHTTTELSPEEIHEIGKKEVERIGGQIKSIMEKIGFNGSIREFTGHVKGMKDIYPENREDILEGYRRILERMDSKLPDFFGRLPKAEYDIKEIEKYREQSAPAAYYYPPPRDFSRPGYFYANTYKPEQRPTFFMEALSYHEAVPGHHLQIAIMQEQQDLPDFRKYEGSTAYIEGWALYAEKLAGEMGFYMDDFAEYGRLNFEIWRAVRLVVDTGLHYYKWGREEAIAYCLENSGEEEHEIEVEVDRYISMPGQALAYKIGELKILELREKAKDVMGRDFDIKGFHDRLLEKGALPLYALESVMDEWMNK